MAAVLSDDDVLARLGVEPAPPYDWGEEAVDGPGPSFDQGAPPPSGLDSVRRYARVDDGRDGAEKRILRSLLECARIDPSTDVTSSVDDAFLEDRDRVLMGDTLRDVSIKGLSDRAMAEANVESRTSLFGSILRLFDAPREGEKADGAVAAGAAAGSGSGGGDKKKAESDAVAASKDTANAGKSTGAAATAAVPNTAAASAVPAAAVPAAASSAAAPAAATAPNAAPAETPKMIVADDPMIMKEPILSTAEIVRSVHLTARPGDVPAGMDSKEFAMAALHFLSSHVPYLHEDEGRYRTDFNSDESNEGWDQLRRTLPVLPLIKAINPGESLELRNYGRVRPLVKLGQKERKKYPDSMDKDDEFRRKVLNLERIYCSSLPYSSPCSAARLSSKLSMASSAPAPINPMADQGQGKGAPPQGQQQMMGGNDLPFAHQRYVPRRKLVPHVEGGAKEELTLMISGHMQLPQHTPGPKASRAPGKVVTKAPAKSKPAVASSGTSKAAPAIVKVSASSAGGGQPKKAPANKKAGVGSQHSTPSKRKAEHEIADGLLHLSKKAGDFVDL